MSSFGNTSFAAEFQAAALPLALWLAVWSGRGTAERVLGGAAAALAVTHLALAESRIDLIAAAAALAVGAHHLLRSRGRRGLARSLGAAVTLAAIAGAWIFVRVANGAGPAWVGRSDTVTVRAHIWSSVREMVTGIPLLLPQGAPFVDLYPDYRHAEEFTLSLGRDVTTPHNDLLGIAVTLGVVGLLVAVACASRLWRRLATAEQPGAPTDATERAAIAACIAALGVSALASSPLTHGATALLGGLAWGAVIALRPSPRADVSEPRPAHGLAAIALAVAVFPALAIVRSDTFLAEARAGLVDGRALEALEAFDVAAGADDRAHAPRYELGTILHNAGETEQALVALRSAHAIRPGSPATRANLARALLANGDRAEARRLLDASLERVPWHPELLSARAQLALAEDRGADALADYRAAQAMLAHDPRMTALVAEARLAGEPGFPAHEEALDALKGLLAADDRAQIARSVPSMIRRDPTFLASLVATSRRLVATEPEHAALLIAAAVESPVARADAGFLQEGGTVLTRAGWTDAGSRFTGRALGLRARDALAVGDNESALRLAKKAAPRDPDPEHWLVVARALARMEQRNGAIDAIGSAIATGEVDPDAVRADPDLGGLLPNDRLELLLERAGERLGESP